MSDLFLIDLASVMQDYQGSRVIVVNDFIPKGVNDIRWHASFGR